MDDLSFNSPFSRILVIIYQADGMSAFTIKYMAALATGICLRQRYD